MIPRKIIEVPCIVNTCLYISGVRKVWSGACSCHRIKSASQPPIRKKMKAEAPYRIPMRLWSTVVSQLLIPVASWALLMFVSPGSAVRTEIMDEGGDLTLRQRARQFHQRSFLDGVGIMQPTREVLVIVDQHPGHQVVP